MFNQKKDHRELPRFMQGNYSVDGMFWGLLAGFVLSRLGVEFIIALSSGAVVGFAIGYFIKKKPKDSEEK